MINLEQTRKHQAAWAATPLGERLAVVKAFRSLIGNSAEWLAATVAHRPVVDTLASEVLPLADAAKFLHRRGEAILSERSADGMAPFWLPGIRARIRRIPLGVVLIIGPVNYPLFLPGVQAIQALAAGNAVAVKPAPASSIPMQAIAQLLADAGLPSGLFNILPEDSGPEASAAEFDHIVFTGSAATGRKILQVASQRLTPCTMELSGCDAAFVLSGADIGLVAKSLAYGLRLNGGASCIAPRRVFVSRELSPALEAALRSAISGIEPTPLLGTVVDTATELFAAAERSGARIVGTPAEMCSPLLVFDANAEMDLLKTDLFAPWLALVPVQNTEAMLLADAMCPFALGASVWGPRAEALKFARRLRMPSVCINDVIAPTADPRLPFGGRGLSGFGTTRGAEGLLAMTVPQSISTRVLPLRPHLMSPTRLKPNFLSTMAKYLHGTGWS